MDDTLEDKPQPKKLIKNKSFVTRLSNILMRNQSILNKNQQHDILPSILKNKLPSSDSMKSKRSSSAHEFGDTIDPTTQYATVCDMIQAEGSSDESPPIPPKRLDELYAKVNKGNKDMMQTNVGLNTNSARLPVVSSKEGNTSLVSDAKLPLLSKISSLTEIKDLQKKYITTRPREKRKKSSKSSMLKAALLNHQDELKCLREEAKEIIAKNEELQNCLRLSLDQEKKWKEEMSTSMVSQRDYINIITQNSQLNEKITRLELETRHEVQVLCNKVLSMQVERDRLSNEVEVLKRDKEMISTKYNRLKEERSGFVSIQTHLSEIKDYQNGQKEMIEKHGKEVKLLREKCDKYEDEKNSGLIDSQLLKEEKKHLQKEVQDLKQKLKELTEKNEEQSKRVGELSHTEREQYELVVSMTHTINNLMAERDVLLKQTEVHDAYRKELQSTCAQQSHIYLQLDEQITNVRRLMNNEVREASVKVQGVEADYSKMKIFYEEQLEALRNKIVEQTCIINNINEDKKKLRQDFENMWLAVVKNKTISEAEIITQELKEIKSGCK